MLVSPGTGAVTAVAVRSQFVIGQVSHQKRTGAAIVQILVCRADIRKDTTAVVITAVAVSVHLKLARSGFGLGLGSGLGFGF